MTGRPTLAQDGVDPGRKLACRTAGRPAKSTCRGEVRGRTQTRRCRVCLASGEAISRRRAPCIDSNPQRSRTRMRLSAGVIAQVIDSIHIKSMIHKFVTKPCVPAMISNGSQISAFFRFSGEYKMQFLIVLIPYSPKLTFRNSRSTIHRHRGFSDSVHDDF